MACNRASDCCHIGFKPRCATSDAGSPPDWPPSKHAQIRFRNRGGDHRILDAARCFLNNLRRPLLACAVQRRRFPVGASPTRHPLQPEAIGAVMEVTKWLKPSISVSRIGDSASVQAATRVNVEQASKRTMCRPTRLPYRGRLKWLGELSEDYALLLHRGIGGGMYTRKAYATREAPWRGQR